MKILIVSATKFEIEPLLSEMKSFSLFKENFICCTYKNLEIDFLITGVGMVATAYSMGKILNGTYNVAFNAGICGTFNKNLELGTVVNIYEDCFSELGAEDGEEFLTLEDLKLTGINKFINKTELNNKTLTALPKVNGITVNTTHGNEQSINKISKRFHPMVESMEGAAFMMACEYAAVPYAQIRAVSNYVERRNKDNWNIPLALENLSIKLIEILDAF